MRAALLTCVAAAAIGTAGATSAVERSLLAPTRVTGLAVDGSYVALAVAARRRDCFHVRIWDRTTGTVRRLGRPRPCGPTPSTGQRLLGPSIAGNRALWITYGGGNIREWTLWTGSTANPRTPRRLAFIARDVDETGPFVLGEGDASRLGYILPYAIDRTVIVLRPGGSVRFRWTTPARVTALAAKEGELAVALANGEVHVLDAAGRMLNRYRFGTAGLDAVRITGRALLMQSGRTLALQLSEDRLRAWTLPPGARLADAERNLAAYVVGRTVHLLDLDGGRDRIIRRTRRGPPRNSRAATSSWATAGASR
jgi:hypothetical protein